MLRPGTIAGESRWRMRGLYVVCLLLSSAPLLGCMEQRPFGALDKPTLDIAARTPDMRRQNGAVLLVRITKDGEGCRLGKARLRTLASAVVGGEAYTIGQKSPLDDLLLEEAAGQKLQAIFTLNLSTLLKWSEFRAVDVAYVSIPPGDYILTRIECSQGNTIWSMGNDYGSTRAFSNDTATMPIRGANAISVKAGEIVDAGVLDIQERERGFWTRPTGEVVSKEVPDEYKQRIAEKLPDLARATTYRRFTAFSACNALTELLGSHPALAKAACDKQPVEMPTR